MRLRELRKLVEQLTVGGGALVVEDLAEVDVLGVHDGSPAGWSLTPEFLPLGPIHLEPRPYIVSLNMQAIGDSVAGDALTYTFYSVDPNEPGGATAWAGSSIMVADDWPTSAWQGVGNLGWGGPGMTTPLGPTDLYLLIAASNQVGDGPPSAPVTVRHRHLGVLPI